MRHCHRSLTRACLRAAVLTGVMAAHGRAQGPAPVVPLIIEVQDETADADADLPMVNSGFTNDQDVAGPIAPLVVGLRATGFAERATAQEALLRLPPERLKDVVEALSHETEPEAIERLTQVAAHLYLKPRTLLRTKVSLLGLWFAEPSVSMLGIKFKMDPVKLKPQDVDPLMAATVTEIQVGFPAMQTLRNGDRIVAIGGVGFPPNVPPEDTTYFRGRIADLWPGGVVTMAILRDGKLMGVDVQITGLPLDGPSSPTEMVAQREAVLRAFLQTLKTGEKGPA
jgi:hypothetical protein